MMLQLLNSLLCLFVLSDDIIFFLVVIIYKPISLIIYLITYVQPNQLKMHVFIIILDVLYMDLLYIHTYIHTYIHIYIHTYIHTYIHIYTHTYIHTYTHTYIYTWYIHIYTHIHTYIYTHIHIYTWYIILILYTCIIYEIICVYFNFFQCFK